MTENNKYGRQINNINIKSNMKRVLENPSWLDYLEDMAGREISREN